MPVHGRPHLACGALRRPSVRLSLYIDCFCRLTTSPGRRHIAYLVMVATSQPPRQLYGDHVAVGPLSCLVRDVVS